MGHQNITQNSCFEICGNRFLSRKHIHKHKTFLFDFCLGKNENNSLSLQGVAS